eukprot:282408-Rhodomonas_salina.1
MIHDHDHWHAGRVDPECCSPLTLHQSDGTQPEPAFESVTVMVSSRSSESARVTVRVSGCNYF